MKRLLRSSYVLRGAAVTFLVVLLGSPARPQTLVPTEHRLANGLRVRLMPNPGSGLVASNVFVGAGSTREEDRFAGSSHFLEHLLFNGTERRTQEELYAETDRIGAYNNATTKQEFTHFMMVAPSEQLAAALDIQADMLLHSVLPPEKFEKERGIVIEEISKDRDDPDYVAQGELDTLLFGAGSDFARPVLGTPETIAALPRTAVLEYYHRQYVPSNMLVLLMGEFDPDDALARIEELFDPPAGDAAPAPTLRWPDGPALRAAPLAGDRTHLRLAVPLPSPGEAGYGEATLLASILGDDESSRIQRALAAEPALETASLSVGLVHREGQTYLDIQASLDAGVPHEDVIHRICGAMAELGQNGVQPGEWRIARTRALGTAIAQVEQLHYYALLQGDRIWHSPSGFEREYLRDLADAWPHLNAVARERFGHPDVQVCVTGPGVTPVDHAIDLGELGYVASAATPAPDTGRATEQEMEPAEPPVVTEIQPPSATVLPDGMTLIHAATPTTRMFGLHLMVKDRSAREPEGKAGIADLLHRMLRNGAGPYDREELARRLASIGAELKVTDNPWIPYDDYYTTPEFSYVRLQCVDTYYAEAIRLLGLMITQPHLDDGALERDRNDMLGILGRSAKRPQEAADRALAELLYPDQPLASPVLGTPQSLARIDLDDVRAFAPRYFDPPYLVLAVVGNIPRSQIEALVPSSFSFGERTATTIPTSPTLTVTKQDRRQEIEVGGEQSALRIARIVRVDPGDRWALQAAARIASDQMQQDLRETRGLAYSLGISASFLGDRSVLVASLGTRPENAGEAEEGMREFLAGGRREVTPEELEAAVNGYLGRMRMRRVTRLGQAFNLSQDYVFGTGLDQARQETLGLQAVTLPDVERALDRYLGPGPLVTVVAR